MTGGNNRIDSPEIRKIAGMEMAKAFRSPVIAWLRRNGYRIRSGNTTIALAAEFGFCYGVYRAVEYAYAARYRFPDRRLWITGEIIHNPRVNRRLSEMGIRFLPAKGNLEERFGDLEEGDVVLIPAFGADAREMIYLVGRGFEIVDTTCGSVLNVWKWIRKYAKEGYTAVIHGKYDHEETLATCSQVMSANKEGKFVVLRDLGETRLLASMIVSGDFDGFFPRFERSASDGIEPERHLKKIGLANQTTMLESESREIQEVLHDAMTERYGAESLDRHFRVFDTICSATEDRQQAVKNLLGEGLDRIIVIGGYNSSNTAHLVEIASRSVPAYHIESADCILGTDRIIAKPLDGEKTVTVTGWLPEGEQIIGVTGGASTPDSVVGHVIERIMDLRGMKLE